jgi:hypothetical protein
VGPECPNGDKAAARHSEWSAPGTGSAIVGDVGVGCLQLGRLGGHELLSTGQLSRTWHCDHADRRRRTIARRRLRSPRDPRRGDRVRYGAIVPAARLTPPHGRLQNFDRRHRRTRADVWFEGWLLATAWIGASDGAACGPRNPARATLRRPALLIAVSGARADTCRASQLHMQSRFRRRRRRGEPPSPAPDSRRAECRRCDHRSMGSAQEKCDRAERVGRVRSWRSVNLRSAAGS